MLGLLLSHIVVGFSAVRVEADEVDSDRMFTVFNTLEQNYKQYEEYATRTDQEIHDAGLRAERATEDYFIAQKRGDRDEMAGARAEIAMAYATQINYERKKLRFCKKVFYENRNTMAGLLPDFTKKSKVPDTRFIGPDPSREILKNMKGFGLEVKDILVELNQLKNKGIDDPLLNTKVTSAAGTLSDLSKVLNRADQEIQFGHSRNEEAFEIIESFLVIVDGIFGHLNVLDEILGEQSEQLRIANQITLAQLAVEGATGTILDPIRSLETIQVWIDDIRDRSQNINTIFFTEKDYLPNDETEDSRRKLPMNTESLIENIDFE